MKLTRREFGVAVAGAAGVAALAPVAKALPEAHGCVSLAPIEFTTFGIVESVSKQENGALRFTYTGMWALKPFVRGFEVRYLTPVFVDEEFTDADRPGTGGGVQGHVPDVYRFWEMEPGIWAVEIELAEFGNRVPDKPLWIHAEGVIWR